MGKLDIALRKDPATMPEECIYCCDRGMVVFGMNEGDETIRLRCNCKALIMAVCGFQNFGYI